ncbi:MAG: ATP-dependent metallopeptidase FtsH/Yme1/Tma family protein, partial [Mailhella sp.]|nr:ATP-dependent metallopeptidase FtsH/Yme1/Tma family protein [Mailhella sp.]
MNQFTRNILLWSVIAVAMISIFSMFNEPVTQSGNTVAYSTFMSQVQNGEVSRVVIEDRNLTVGTHDGQTYSTYAPEDPSLVQQLKDKNVVIDVKKPEETPLAMSIFVSWFPMLLLIGVWIFFARQQMGGSGKA